MKARYSFAENYQKGGSSSAQPFSMNIKLAGAIEDAIRHHFEKALK